MLGAVSYVDKVGCKTLAYILSRNKGLPTYLLEPDMVITPLIDT